MLKHWLIFAGLAAALAGCGGRATTVSQAPQDYEQFAAAMPIAGAWGAPVNGVRARILIDRREVEETQAVLSAVELENVGAAPVELKTAGGPPVSWNAAGVGVGPDYPIDPNATQAALTLVPGQKFITRPAEVLMPPGPAQRELAAQFVAQGASVVVPPVELQVHSAEWGQTIDGIRVRISSARNEYAVGEKVVLRVFFHNVSGQPLSIHPIDDASEDVDTRRDLVTFSFTTLDEEVRQVQPGALASRVLRQPLLLAPGAYRVRVVVTSRELSIDHPAAWHGRVVSNDFPLRIQ